MASARPRVVCLDSVMIDFSVMVDASPDRGGDVRALGRLVSTGGGFNMMSAARRQGVAVLYAGQLGVGPFADLARESVVAEGIDLAIVQGEGIDLGVCVVIVDGEGERTFITSPGAEITLSSEDLSLVSVQPGDVVYLSGYNVLYPEVSRAALDWLSALDPGVVVAFDPGPRVGDIPGEHLSQILARTDWLLCNTTEARVLALELSEDADVVVLARRLRDQGGHDRVVVRDGAHGCVGVSVQGVLHAPGFKSEVIDTNGAGDVHNGVLIAELSRGTSFEEVLRRANAAASISIARLGPATCPPRELVDALLSTTTSRTSTVVV